MVITISNGLPTETCTGTLSNGSGSCVLPVTLPGTGSGNRRVITATYAGDARFSGDTDTENHRVDPTANLSPIAGDDSYQATEDVALVVNAADGVLKNDSDPEGGPLTAVNASNPARGSVTLNEDGSFTYTPDENLAGDDTFTYSARDAAGNTTTATVTIHVAPVNDPPQGATFVPPNCSAGVPCQFHAEVFDPDQGDVLTYHWDFGDTTTGDGCRPVPHLSGSGPSYGHSHCHR